jgi:hypothetical protein
LKKGGEIKLKGSKLFFKEVLHIMCGPHPDPLPRKKHGTSLKKGEGENIRIFYPEESSLTY